MNENNAVSPLSDIGRTRSWKTCVPIRYCCRAGAPDLPADFCLAAQRPIVSSELLRQSKLDPLTLRKSEDAYVDELFGAVAEFGAPSSPRAFRAPSSMPSCSRRNRCRMFDGPVSCRVGPRTRAWLPGWA